MILTTAPWVPLDASSSLRLHMTWLDYLFLVVYFAVVLAIGWIARSRVKSSLDFLLSGRSMPAWITGLAFVAANLGATEVLGMAANGAQLGMVTMHYYWIGAVPAMVFLGLFMMPFYYASGVRSVPEFMQRRFGAGPHLICAIAFAVSNLLIAGINLYAMALIIEAMLGWPQWVAIVTAAAFVLCYVGLGGLSSAIYNEVLQFFVIVAGLVPMTIVGLRRVGGWSGLKRGLPASHLSTWSGTAIGHVTNPIGANWLTIVLGLGFVISFGYWTTNFTEVQRAFSAKNMSAAVRTPIIAAFPKIFIPFVIIIPGMIAGVLVPTIGAANGISYNEAIPKMIQMLLPSGVLGVAVTGLMASFMAGMAANVSSFNTVFTYDLWQDYVRKGRSDAYYLKTGRVVTAIGVVVGVGTAFIAASFNNLMTYMQTLFSFFNAPLFAVFILGLLWKKLNAVGGLWGYVAGILVPVLTYVGYLKGILHFGSATAETLYGALYSFAAVMIVGVLANFFGTPKSDAELAGLVYGGESVKDGEMAVIRGHQRWYASPAFLGTLALLLCVAFYIVFA